MLSITALTALLGTAAAYPGMTQESVSQPEPLVARDVPAGPAESYGQSNCGFSGPCKTFNAAQQYVSTTGANAYQDPGKDDLRGPCPGLNAAANHGYLSRSGVTHITNTITGLGAAYGMAPNLAAALAVYAVVFEGGSSIATCPRRASLTKTQGDLLTLAWSIGGPQPALLGGLLGKPSGISYSHNNYEGDSSATRDDYYMNNGNAYSLQVDRFQTGYSYTQNGGYTMDSFRQLVSPSVHQQRNVEPKLTRTQVQILAGLLRQEQPALRRPHLLHLPCFPRRIQFCDKFHE